MARLQNHGSCDDITQTSFVPGFPMVHVHGRKFENAATPTKKYNGKYTEMSVTVQLEPSQICISSKLLPGLSGLLLHWSDKSMSWSSPRCIVGMLSCVVWSGAPTVAMYQ